jgi:uncharacterized cupin superfamily protein
MSPAFVSRVDGSDFEPYEFDEEDVIEGEPNARIHWVRPEGTGAQAVGIYRGDPCVFRYTWHTDETIYVLEGRARVEVEGGETIELGVGDVASFPAGGRSVWHLLEPFCELFVLSA